MRGASDHAPETGIEELSRLPSVKRDSVGPCRAAALSLALALGCTTVASVAERTEDFESVMTVDGVERTFQVHLPDGYTGATEHPMLIALHGSGGSGASLRFGTDLDVVADSHGVIMVYPDGAPGWVWDDSFSDNVDDIEFIKQLIERVDDFVAVDRDRVYMTGFSAGGMMSHKLACTLTDRLGGVVMVGATLPNRIANTCYPPFGRRIAVLGHRVRDLGQGREDRGAGLAAVPQQEGHDRLARREESSGPEVPGSFHGVQLQLHGAGAVRVDLAARPDAGR